MRNHKAFTLVELLVVIAIIALLISILLPSLNAARDQMKKVRCMNNLKQIGLSLELYRSDYRDRIPASGGHNETADPQDWWLNVLARSYDTDLVYRCPKDESANFLDWHSIKWDTLTDEEREAMITYRWGSYALNYLIAKEPEPFCDNMSRVPRPIYTIVAAESQTDILGIDHIHPERFMFTTPERQVATERHGGRANYLFADSHIASLRLDETWEPLKRDLWNPESAPHWSDDFQPPPPPPGGL